KILSLQNKYRTKNRDVAMKKIGYVLIVVGVVLLGFSFFMNTTSYTDGLGRINDLSLLFSQQNRIIVFCFI
ncbi:hypothetical protein CGH19_24780, partial [Vibrio parahaemolyticus]